MAVSINPPSGWLVGGGCPIDHSNKNELTLRVLTISHILTVVSLFSDVAVINVLCDQGLQVVNSLDALEGNCFVESVQRLSYKAM